MKKYQYFHNTIANDVELISFTPRTFLLKRCMIIAKPCSHLHCTSALFSDATELVVNWLETRQFPYVQALPWHSYFFFPFFFHRSTVVLQLQTSSRARQPPYVQRMLQSRPNWARHKMPLAGHATAISTNESQQKV